MPCAAACLWLDPAWYGKWVGPCAASVPWDEFVPGLWEYVIPQNEEEEKKVDEGVNSKNSVEKVPEYPVTNLAVLARLHALEELNLMFWILEFGEEEGLTRATDEKLDRLCFENESVASEVPWKGDVLQVHPKVSLLPTENVNTTPHTSHFLIDLRTHARLKSCVCRAHIICHESSPCAHVFVLTLFDYSTFLSLLTI